LGKVRALKEKVVQVADRKELRMKGAVG